jgi:carbon monoxide dehydrogenase subunit G
MLSFLLIAVIAIVALILCVLGLAATKPARYTVQRTITAQAMPEKVFALINDFHRWADWNEKDATSMTRSFSGAPAGKGAILEWDGQGKSGKVRLEIVESSPKLIRVQADWTKPFVARNFNIFTLEPEGNATHVTWALDGENVFALKAMTVFVSADRLMGSHFEKGLADLKTAAEK